MGTDNPASLSFIEQAADQPVGELRQRLPATQRFKRWRNPYIDKLPSLPDYILAAESEDITETEMVRLAARIADYPKLFLELGSGSGRHLIQKAAEDPKGLYVGFELRFKRVFRTAEKASQQGLKNLMVAKTSAAKVPQICKAGTVDGVYVNFPDPWNKRRWEKHRMLTSELIAGLARTMKPGGFLSYKTDHLQRFSETTELVKQSGLFEISIHTSDLHGSPLAEGNVRTEFESLFVSQNLPIGYLRAVKR